MAEASAAPTPGGARRRRGLLVALIVAIVAVLVLVGVGCVGGLWLFIQNTIRTTGVYEQAMAAAGRSPAVEQRLGAPLEPRWVVMGHVHIEDDAGEADLKIPIAGPRGHGQVHVIGVRAGGEWTIDRLTVEFEDGALVTVIDAGTGAGAGGELDRPGRSNDDGSIPIDSEAVP